MSKKQNQIEILNKIKNAAVLYKQNLVGKRFMYVFDERYIEVIFKAENFRHLTGVETKLSAKSFYDYARKGKLSANQFGFGPIHPYSLCTRKVKHIEDIATMAMSECFMLEDIKTNTMNYKFGTTDLELTLCLNRESDKYGNEKSECFVVQSMRDEDCFSKCKNAYTVTHIFSRFNNETKYNQLLYLDKNAQITDLSDEILSMLDEKLLK